MFEPRILTVYGPDGKKVRKPVGFKGGTCSIATKPYEEREISGQSVKTLTPEAFECDNAVSVEEKINVGGGG